MIARYWVVVLVMWMPILSSSQGLDTQGSDSFSHPRRLGHTRNQSDTALILAVHRNRTVYPEDPIAVQPSIQYKNNEELVPLLVHQPRPKKACCYENVMPYAVWAYDVACFQAHKEDRRNGKWGCCAASCACAFIGLWSYIAYSVFYFPPETCYDTMTFAGIFGIPPALGSFCSCLSSKPVWQYTKDDVATCLTHRD